MSLFGKVLAFLNILGAIGLVYMGALDYGKRYTWAYHVFWHELLIDGLPLDENVLDSQGHSIAKKIPPSLQQQLFAQASGQPVTTQQAEADRVSGLLKGKVEAAKTREAKMATYAWLLLPFADTGPQRQALIAYQTYLGSDAAFAALKKRYEQAFREAAGETRRPFEEALRQALRAQGGEPSEPFTVAFLNALPADPKEMRKADFAKTFEKALNAQQADLDREFQEAISTTRKTVKGQPSDLSPVQRRTAIARLLLAASSIFAEDDLLSPQVGAEDKKAITGLTPDSVGFRMKVPESQAYKRHFNRMQAVVGVPAAVAALTDRGRELQVVAGDLARSAAAERSEFVAAHQELLAVLQERAAQVEAEMALLDRQKKQLADQEQLVKKRQRDVKQAEDDLAESRRQTGERLKELRAMSQNLYELRLKLRNAIDKNFADVEEIRKLERQIEELEGER
jgi:hypothetical protein